MTTQQEYDRAVASLLGAGFDEEYIERIYPRPKWPTGRKLTPHEELSMEVPNFHGGSEARGGR